MLIADAKAHGFAVVRVTRPDAIPSAAARLREFLAAGRHGSMAWLEDTSARRSDPRQLWPEVRSVVMLGLNYGPSSDPLAVLQQKDRGAISVYARSRDYHELIRGRIKEIANRLSVHAKGKVKVFVDTAPVMEKPLAAAAGIGWQGKHTNLVSREFGSWLFLGAIFTDIALPEDAAEKDNCGACRACLDACPTGAFPAPYQLDARRCISYLTIEHEGPIPIALRPAIGNRIYGCDDCLAVCPWNKFAQAGREAKLAARADLEAPPLAELAQLDEPGFRTFFSASPIKRIGRDRFVRNVLIAIGNSGEPVLLPVAERLIEDPSPIVRGAAIWAVRRLSAAPAFAKLRDKHLPAESLSEVREEWLERGMSHEPMFFASVKEWRGWLAANHASSDGLEVGLIKKGAGIPGILLEEAVDEALCWGWIDSRAHSIDRQRWVIRMTPRRPKSPWSAISIKRVERLIADGRVAPAGRAAFEKRAFPTERRNG